MAQLQKNQLHTVTITGYTSEGLGVARIDGQVVFVHNAVRGEICTVRILKVLKHNAFARVEEILERSPARREPDCLILLILQPEGCLFLYRNCL